MSGWCKMQDWTVTDRILTDVFSKLTLKQYQDSKTTETVSDGFHRPCVELRMKHAHLFRGRLTKLKWEWNALSKSRLIE